MTRNIIIIFTGFFYFLQLPFAMTQQQDSLLGFASTNEAYRSISAEKTSFESGEEFIEPLDVEMIQQELLEDNQALLEYFILDSRVCVFYISKNDFQKKIISKDFPLEEWVDFLTTNLSNPDFEAKDFNSRNKDFIEKSHLIYKKIFAPLEIFGLPDRLLIKPDGVLKDLPFEVFLTQTPEDFTDYENHAYLSGKYKISYCHSTIAHQQMRQRRELSSNRFLTFASSPEENIQEEAITIYRKFGGEICQENEATASVFKSQAPLFQAIHLPDFHEKELKDLPQLNAELVVFSIIGKEKKVFSSVKEFSEKGVKSIVTNLWVTDATHRLDFLKDFYHHIYQKKPKDTALQKAKIDMIRWTSGVEGHPHFWAGHVLFGVSEGVDLQGIRFDLWFLVGLMLMLFLGVVFIKKGVI